ncbi:hypothetical protein FDECE_1314 [Fusarium decemcellulare]|nr:hypothetical protein FDECE_1314 [Fusarium decemcellulare]
MASDIKPFKIQVSDSELDSLKNKLSNSSFTSEVDFSDDWNYGTPLSDVKRLAAYWRDGFDWRAQEAKLNELPQFTTPVSVDGFGDIEVHFLHQKSSKADSIPLLFCHGWPGSFLEVLKILPLLTDTGNGPSFHVVAPSLPNFGFSEGVKKRGFAPPQYAETLHKLMLKLGYDKYVTQGGDWGYIVTRLIGVQYPDSCVASHLNFVRVIQPPAFTKTPWQYLVHALFPYAEHEKEGIARTNWFHREGFGYNLEQSTKPSTVGFAFADSPVALLAWIYEKLHDWTDSYPWTDDEILTWISVYQFSTAGPAASARIYYESKHANTEQTKKGDDYLSRVPLGLSYFPKDITVPPKTWGRTLGPIVFEKIHPDGGHFAAHERPKQLAEDLKEMFGNNGGASHVCDETLPCCKRCMIRREQCSYLKEYGNVNTLSPGYMPDRPKSRATLSPSPSSSLEQPSSSLSLHDLDLTHQYLTQTYATLWGKIEGQLIWRDVIFQMALDDRILLDGLLATAAMHKIASSRSPNPQLENIALQKQGTALEGLRMRLQSCDAGMWEPLFPLSVLLSYWTFASRQLPDKLNILSTSSDTDISTNYAMNSPTEQFLLLVRRSQPTRTIVTENREWYLHGRLSELTRVPEIDKLPALDHQVEYAISQLEHHLHEESAVTRIIQTKVAVFSLRGMFRLTKCPELTYLLVGWPMQLSEAYIENLRQRDQGALTVLCFWAVCFERLSELWWAAGWGKALVMEISEMVQGPWLELVKWPRLWLGLDRGDGMNIE